ncbi:MAG TPA: ATP-binding protein [Candidatus Eisenbacteria bacterium]|nr:ATP-binding protein [Candidatus Eisenbacteria bacterium]
MPKRVGQKEPGFTTRTREGHSEPGSPGGTPETLRTERRYRRDIASLQDMFAFVSEFLAARGVPTSNAFALELILEELFTNVLKYRKGGDDSVEVRLGLDGDRIVLSFVEFQVEPFDITKIPEPDLTGPAHERRAGGMGIHLVKKLSDRVSYEHKDGVSVTTITKGVER